LSYFSAGLLMFPLGHLDLSTWFCWGYVCWQLNSSELLWIALNYCELISRVLFISSTAKVTGKLCNKGLILKICHIIMLLQHPISQVSFLAANLMLFWSLELLDDIKRVSRLYYETFWSNSRLESVDIFSRRKKVTA
jgi:hypothetical protein